MSGLCPLQLESLLIKKNLLVVYYGQGTELSVLFTSFYLILTSQWVIYSYCFPNFENDETEAQRSLIT